MENVTSGVLMTLCLLVGMFSGAFLFPTEKEIKVDVPGVCEECPECEVCEETIVEVPAPSLLDKAVEDFMKAVEDEEDEAGNLVDALMDYDFEEISVSKVYNDYTILQEGDDNVTITFNIKLKYDEDGEKSKKEKYNVKVTYVEDEDTEVKIITPLE